MQPYNLSPGNVFQWSRLVRSAPFPSAAPLSCLPTSALLALDGTQPGGSSRVLQSSSGGP